MILKEEQLNQQKLPTDFANYFTGFYMMSENWMSIIPWEDSIKNIKG